MVGVLLLYSMLISRAGERKGFAALRRLETVHVNDRDDN
jgi:hypothetical protein